jgi:hypothetical protein
MQGVKQKSPESPGVAACESPGDRLRRRNATEASVRHLLPALGLDELRVVETVVSRLVMARRQYGELDLDSDTRDFRIEGGEEMADFLFYAAAREVAAMDRRLDRLRCAAADELARMQPVEFGLREFVNTAADYPSAHEIDLGGEAG